MQARKLTESAEIPESKQMAVSPLAWPPGPSRSAVQQTSGTSCSGADALHLPLLSFPGLRSSHPCDTLEQVPLLMICVNRMPLLRSRFYIGMARPSSGNPFLLEMHDDELEKKWRRFCIRSHRSHEKTSIQLVEKSHQAFVYSFLP